MFKKTGHEINAYDFLGPGISLWVYLRCLKDNHADVYLAIVSAFKDFMEDETIINDLMEMISSAAAFIAWELSSPDERYVSIEIGFKSKEDDDSYNFTLARIKGFQPEIMNLNIDGKARPAFRVGVTYNGSDLVWVNLRAETLGLHHFPADYPIPVYIQHHAMNRLNERLDCAQPVMIFLNMVDSIVHAKCIRCNGKKLVEFYYLGNKIGYLVIELIDGVAVIRTFLLLTNGATPEGDALQKIIGLEKPDVSYLNLDKLSTFAHSDLRGNKQLRDIFARAGCNPLFEVQKHDYDKQCCVTAASTIEAYIGKYREYTNCLQFEELSG